MGFDTSFTLANSAAFSVDNVHPASGVCPVGSSGTIASLLNVDPSKAYDENDYNALERWVIDNWSGPIRIDELNALLLSYYHGLKGQPCGSIPFCRGANGGPPGMTQGDAANAGDPLGLGNIGKAITDAVASLGGALGHVTLLILILVLIVLGVRRVLDS